MLSANLITTLEAASLLRISQPYIYNIIKAGRLTVIGKFGRNMVLSRPEVERFKLEREEYVKRSSDGRVTRWSKKDGIIATDKKQPSLRGVSRWVRPEQQEAVLPSEVGR